MLDNPTNTIVTPTPTTQTSLFQTGSVALRGNQAINFAAAKPGAVAVLNNVGF